MKSIFNRMTSKIEAFVCLSLYWRITRYVTGLIAVRFLAFFPLLQYNTVFLSGSTYSLFVTFVVVVGGPVSDFLHLYCSFVSTFSFKQALSINQLSWSTFFNLRRTDLFSSSIVGSRAFERTLHRSITSVGLASSARFLHQWTSSEYRLTLVYHPE